MKYFNKSIIILVQFMIPLVIIAIMLGFARLIIDLRIVFNSPTAEKGLRYFGYQPSVDVYRH